MSVNPPPPPLRRSLWVSRLGRSAAVVVLVGVALTAVDFAWPDDGPSWLGLGGAIFYLGVVLVALWTVLRLFDTSARLRARQRNIWDDRDRPA